MHIIYRIGDGNGNALQYSCLEKQNGQRSLVGYTVHGVTKSQTWLSMQYRIACWKQGPSTFYGIVALATDSPKDAGLAQESVTRTRRLSGRSERGWESILWPCHFPSSHNPVWSHPKGNFNLQPITAHLLNLYCLWRTAYHPLIQPFLTGRNESALMAASNGIWLRLT